MEKRIINTRILEQKGKNALIEKENCDIECRDEYLVICALNYQNYLGMHLYNNASMESVRFSVSTQVPQEVKDEILQIARKYFDSISK